MRILLGIAAALFVVGARAAEAPMPARLPTQVLVLTPTPSPPLRIDFNYNFDKALPPFAREPRYEGKEIARGRVPTVPPTPLVRNITDNELYLNTDHEPDFLSGKQAIYRSSYQGHVLFTNLHLSTVRGDLTIPYTADLFTYEHGCAGWLWIQSGWAAELQVNGEKWRLGIVDNLDGQIGAQDILFVQRDKTNRDNPVLTFSPVPKALFLGGRTFDLAFVFKPGPTGAVVEATLTEQETPLGKLNLEAAGCRYVCLTNDRMAIVLETGQGAATLPTGAYQIADCVLERAPKEFRTPVFIRSKQSVVVSQDRVPGLRVGLPLQNTVVACRDRNLMRLTYQLLGAGGEQYEYYDWTHRPGFTVWKGPVKVGSGKFPFG